MEAGQPSRTALMTAITRARHCEYAPDPQIVADHLAFVLSGLSEIEEAQAQHSYLIDSFSELSDRDTAAEFVTRIEEAVCMRSRLTDEILLSGEYEQLVVLGAGLDSTAYRFSEKLGNIALFEVDHPSTQEWKKDRLSKSGISLPERLSLIPCDFDMTTLHEAFIKGAVRSNSKTLFSWLGVQPYLDDRSITKTLGVLGKFAKGSTLVMDFIMPQEEDANTENKESVRNLQKIVNQMGEPMKSAYTEAQLEWRLKQAGFSKITFYSIKDMVNQYLDGDFSVISTPPEAVYLVSATV